MSSARQHRIAEVHFGSYGENVVGSVTFRIEAFNFEQIDDRVELHATNAVFVIVHEFVVPRNSLHVHEPIENHPIARRVNEL